MKLSGNLLSIEIQRKEADTDEQKAGPHERQKEKGRTETTLLPASGENAGAPDAGTDP